MKKQALVRTVLAVVASTALATVLLLGFPVIYVFIFFFVVLPASFIMQIDPVEYSYIIVPIMWIVGGITVFLPGLVLNVAMMRIFSIPYKIISIIFYVLLLVGIAVLLSGFIYYQMNHSNIKV